MWTRLPSVDPAVVVVDSVVAVEVVVVATVVAVVATVCISSSQLREHHTDLEQEVAVVATTMTVTEVVVDTVVDKVDTEVDKEVTEAKVVVVSFLSRPSIPYVEIQNADQQIQEVIPVARAAATTVAAPVLRVVDAGRCVLDTFCSGRALGVVLRLRLRS